MMTAEFPASEAVTAHPEPAQFLPPVIRLLVADDDESVLQVTQLILSRFRYQGRQLDILQARSAAEVRRYLQEYPDIAVLLLDVVMESDDAGLQLVDYIRHQLGNHRMRILLRTGQAGYAPERQVVQDYDINDYLLKSEVTQSRLWLSLTTAIRGYSDILRAEWLAGQVGDAQRQQQQAQQASLAKTRFLAHMSHEIRTPLNGIAGIVELLSQTALDSEQASLVMDLRAASEAMLGVVNDVLDVAKIEAGKLELHQQDFSLADLLRAVAAVFSASMRLKQIDFQQYWPDTADLWLHGDRQRLQQILINYLSNALKFTPAGGRVTLRVSCRPEGPVCVLRAEVDDTGPGISAQRLPDIFNAFEQESAATSLQFGGTGLGLNLCRSLAELMQGEVGVQSEPGKGSCFWLQLPLPLASAPEPTLTVLAAESGPRLQGMRLALCEDDATSRKVMQRMLERQGARVLLYENGQQLLDDDAFASCEAIILDYHMPVLDGLTTAAALRQSGFRGPLLALTAAATEDERQHCLAAGMDRVMSKPVEWSLLIDWLQECRNTPAS
ncbi:response regulator [Oceanospirillaceae bacterium ASx5O]|nr:response regulator [Oceanospirillaceae bacterium ASx5O]